MNTSACFAAVLLCSSAVAEVKAALTLRLHVDLTDAPRHIIHVIEQIPVHPGTNDLLYPEWIPGEERSGGEIDNLTGLFFRDEKKGTSLSWRRDPSNPYEFHVDVPAGVSSLTARFDVLDEPSHKRTTETKYTSSHVVMLETSRIVLYPGHSPVSSMQVSPTFQLPSGWKAATAMRVNDAETLRLYNSDTTFQITSLEQFVDSPILTGDRCRQYPLATESHPAHTLDVCADNDSGLQINPEQLAHMSDLVRQASKLFGAHHYHHYDFLVALSSHLSGDSQEHTQSAHYTVSANSLADADAFKFVGYLVSHEYTHAWCGKYRRPAGIATPDYNTPMQNDMLWVYEGLTEYLGDVLNTRSGFRSVEDSIREFDYVAFLMDSPGHKWRSLQDLSDASPVLREVNVAGSNWKLDQNAVYYDGALLWLETDATIRQLSHGTKSLDDFAVLFFGAPRLGLPLHDTDPGVEPFTFMELIEALNRTQPYDWRGFWLTRLNALSPHAPTAGLTAAGYDYDYAEQMDPSEAEFMKESHMAEMYFSLGFQANPDGTLPDVWMDSPAYIAGLGPGDKLTQVDGKSYSAEALLDSVRLAKNNPKPITLTAVRDGETKTFVIPYHEGLRFAVLKRNSNPDLLSTAILLPK